VLSSVDATYSHTVLQVPTVETTTALTHCVSYTALVPQLQLCRLHLLLSVRYVSDVHSPVPEPFTVPVSRRRCCSCSNASVSGCCQEPVPVPVPVPVPEPVPVTVPDFYRYPGSAACHTVCISLSFGHNVALLCTAVCSTPNVTSSTASCVLLFNGDVQTPNVLSQHKCRLNHSTCSLTRAKVISPCIHPYDATFKMPKYVAGIYKCYIKFGIN
jgi:hypothetical protein